MFTPPGARTANDLETASFRICAILSDGELDRGAETTELRILATRLEPHRGIQPDLTYLLLARVGGRRRFLRSAAAPRAVRPRSPVLIPGDRAPPPFGDGRPALSDGQREVLLIRREARPDRVRPADPLKPG